MPDTKITALAAITTVAPANDLFPIVDVSDNSMAASGTTKNITVNQLLGAGGTATLASATITGAANFNGGALAGYLNGSLLFGSSGNTVNFFGQSSGFAFKESTGVNNLLTINTSGFVFGDGAGGTRMTLNATGLGVGRSPSYRLQASSGTKATTASLATVAGITTTDADDFGIYFRLKTDATGANRYSAITSFDNGAGNGARDLVLQDLGGNVGIGVTPSAWNANSKALQLGSIGTVENSNNADFNLGCNYNRTSAGLVFSFGTTKYATAYSQNTANGTHAWLTSTTAGNAGAAASFTQAMTLAASGNLLLGTTTDIAAVRMQVWSADSNNTAYFRNSNATTPYGPSVKYTAATPNNTGSEFLYCEDSTALRVALRSNGGIANYQANNVSLSDSRMKSDIKPLGSYWAKIKSLELVTFKYKDQTHSDDNIGLIAQQVESVAPELVDVDGFGETPVDGVPLKTIYTTDLYHASIKALQEAMSRIEALEAKLA